MAGALEQPVEVVGIDRHLTVGGGEPVLFADEEGDEGCVARALRQDALAYREHEHVVEIQAARFEHTHNLQPHSRLAVERHRHRAQHLADEPEQRGLHHGQLAVLQQEHKTVEHGVGTEESLGVEVAQQFVALGVLPGLLRLCLDGFAELFQIGHILPAAGQDERLVAVRAGSVGGCLTVHLRHNPLHPVLHTGVSRRVVQGETLRHVHIAYRGRQRM